MTANEWLERGSQSISSGAQYVTLSCTNAFHIQVLVIYFFCNLTHKTATVRANSWATTNSKPPGQIIIIYQSEVNTEPQSGPIYYTLLYAGAQHC